MALLTMPIEDAGTDGAFYFTSVLEGKNYQWVFQYNDREGYWYFDILDEEGEHIRSGVKIVSNFPIIRPCVNEDRPPGELMFLDTRPEPSDPALAELGEEVVFAYESTDE